MDSCNPASDVSVSVVMPIYNSMRFLPETIDSVRSQSLQDIEIIAVDNGSTDGSIEYLESLGGQDDRLTVLKCDQRGAANARNMGIEYSHGEYLVFLDSDDLFEADMLQRMYLRIRQTGSDLCMCASDMFTESLSDARDLAFGISFNPRTIDSAEVSAELFQTTTRPPWDKMFRSSIIKGHRIRFQDQKVCNDAYFTQLAAFLSNRITILDDVLVHYRCGYGGSTQGKAPENATCTVRAAAKLRYDVLERLRQEKRADETDILSSLSKFCCAAFMRAMDNASYYSDPFVYEPELQGLWDEWELSKFDADSIEGSVNRLKYLAVRNAGIGSYLCCLRDCNPQGFDRVSMRKLSI